jgi:ADP-ribose pyrophosphatase YjhB (NUDIX family)
MRQRESGHQIDPAGLSAAGLLARERQGAVKGTIKGTIISPSSHDTLQNDRHVLASEPCFRKDQRDGISVPMNWARLRKPLEPLLRRFFHLYWRFARGMTLGVRAVVVDRDDRVFLVQHSYVSGWHLPGGGVETGETFLDALRRELIEEGRIEIAGEPALHGLFFNSHVSRRDHVAVYVVRQFAQDRLPEPNREIVASGFFEVEALPEETTEGTRLRISEVLDGQARIATWR